MDDYACTVHVCDNPQAIESTEEGLVTLLEGLGRNILKHLGKTAILLRGSLERMRLLGPGQRPQIIGRRHDTKRR